MFTGRFTSTACLWTIYTVQTGPCFYVCALYHSLHRTVAWCVLTGPGSSLMSHEAEALLATRRLEIAFPPPKILGSPSLLASAHNLKGLPGNSPSSTLIPTFPSQSSEKSVPLLL